MPAYNFKKQFADAVAAGRKRQTIRKPRKRPTSPGDRLYLYTGMRTKGCRKLREVDCDSVTPLELYFGLRAFSNGVEMSGAEIVAMARADGFVNALDFFEFFGNQYGLPIENLEIITW